MPVFSYKSADSSNRLFTGRLEASDQADAARKLQVAGQIPISISEHLDRKWVMFRQTPEQGRRIPRSDFIVFLSNLEMLLSAGIDLNAALNSLAKSSVKEPLKTTIVALRDGVQKGESLSDALAKANAKVPSFIVPSLKAGEAGGQLRTVLVKLADHLSRFEKFRSDLISALIYPAILMAMAVLTIAILLTVVIPQFKPLFENAGAELPVITKIVLGASDLIIGNTLFIVLFATGFMLLVRRLLNDQKAALAVDKAKLSLPFRVGNLLKKIEIARFTRLSALLLESGMTLPAALHLTSEAAANRAFAQAIDQVLTNVREGERFTCALSSTAIMPPLYQDVLEAGEDASQLQIVLARVAEMAERETELALKNFMAVFVPLLTIALGGFVAGIIMSVLLALLSANDLVQ